MLCMQHCSSQKFQPAKISKKTEQLAQDNLSSTNIEK